MVVVQSCCARSDRVARPHPLGLLPARRQRPRHRRPAEQRDEVASPDHSITS
jgi:hypothetical protein